VAAALLAIMLVGLLRLVPPPFDFGPRTSACRPDTSRCVDEIARTAGVRDGTETYWTARHSRSSSRQGLTSCPLRLRNHEIEDWVE